MSHYTFPAIHGHQGKYDYFLIQCQLRLLPRLFLFDEVEIPVNLRRTHIINSSSVARWVDYISSHKEDYILAPLIAAVDESIIFEPLLHDVPEIGHVKIPMSARLVIRDGQHRRAAIKSLLAQDAALGNDTISIMLIPDPDLDRVVNLYIDLHPNQMRPTRSMRVLYDQEEFATLVRKIVDEIPLFRGLTELEKTTISNRSTALFTLSAVYQATQALLKSGTKDTVSIEQAALAHQFWLSLGEIIPEWRQVICRETTAAMLRQNYIHSHTVTLLAIGIAGHELINAHPSDWQERLKILGNVDWSRNNKTLWERRAMIRGKMNKSRDSINLTANAIKHLLGLELTERELVLEQTLLGS